jgi:hypothetical protein
MFPAGYPPNSIGSEPVTYRKMMKAFAPISSSSGTLLRAILEAARAHGLIEIGVATDLLTRSREAHDERLFFHQTRSRKVIGDIDDAHVVLMDWTITA